MVDDGPNERSVGIKSRLVAEDLELFSNLPGAQPFSAPLAAERVGSCHLRSTTPLRNGQGRPARTHPNEQPRVLRQCKVARRYGSEHVSAGRASALGHFWRLPFLLRIIFISRARRLSDLLRRIRRSDEQWEKFQDMCAVVHQVSCMSGSCNMLDA